MSAIRNTPTESNFLNRLSGKNFELSHIVLFALAFDERTARPPTIVEDGAKQGTHLLFLEVQVGLIKQDGWPLLVNDPYQRCWGRAAQRRGRPDAHAKLSGCAV
jgi:hypothetical protein